MFNFSDKTQANITFKMLELFRTLKADKQVKTDASNIAEVKLANILSPDRTFMEASDQVKEIYIIELTLTSKSVPAMFIDLFNKYIEFQTLFKLIYGTQVKYISSIKQFADEKMKILKTFESDWQTETTQDFLITNKLENVFKTIITNITGVSFRQDEAYSNYISRLEAIKKLKSEIEKQTKTMNNEKQPNLRMALNDKIKQVKKELIILSEDKNER